MYWQIIKVYDISVRTLHHGDKCNSHKNENMQLILWIKVDEIIAKKNYKV